MLPETTAAVAAEPPSAEAVLEIAEALARELQPGRRGSSLSLDSSLERDLGLDSLGRVELLGRLERAFGVRLPEEVLALGITLDLCSLVRFWGLPLLEEADFGQSAATQIVKYEPGNSLPPEFACPNALQVSPRLKTLAVANLALYPAIAVSSLSLI